MNCTNKEQETAECEKRGCDGCAYNKADYLEIMDYKGKKTKTTIDLNKLEDIQRIEIEVVTGDEICRVQYKDGKRDMFDSCSFRMSDFYDGEYTLYDVLDNTNYLDVFKKRETSYEMFNEID